MFEKITPVREQEFKNTVEVRHISSTARQGLSDPAAGLSTLNGNTKYLDELEAKRNQKPEMLTKIMEIANKYGLNRKQKEELINNAIKMADDFHRQNKKGK